MYYLKQHIHLTIVFIFLSAIMQYNSIWVNIGVFDVFICFPSGQKLQSILRCFQEVFTCDNVDLSKANGLKIAV